MRVVEGQTRQVGQAFTVVGVELTRRNLLTLLAKLDGNPPGSNCTILHPGLWVRAVEDSEHYSDRPVGVMHPATEAVIGLEREGWDVPPHPTAV